MQTIDADFFRDLAAQPGGFERIDAMFAEALERRDAAETQARVLALEVKRLEEELARVRG